MKAVAVLFASTSFLMLATAVAMVGAGSHGHWEYMGHEGYLLLAVGCSNIPAAITLLVYLSRQANCNRTRTSYVVRLAFFVLALMGTSCSIYYYLPTKFHNVLHLPPIVPLDLILISHTAALLISLHYMVKQFRKSVHL